MAMNVTDMTAEETLHAPLDRHVLAVLVRRVDGWCIYIGAVPGKNHSQEHQSVHRTGTKVPPGLARSMAQYLFGIDPDGLPYAL